MSRASAKIGPALPAALSLLLLIAPAARAQDDADELRLSLGYDGRLLFKVLDIQIEERATGYGFSSTARLVSTGILRLLKHIDERTSSQGRISGGSPQPGTFENQRFASKTRRKTRVVWTGSDVVMTTSVPYGSLGDPPASKEQKLAAADPLTQLMRVTLEAGKPGVCRKSYMFFDGKQLYALDFSNRRESPPSPAETRLGLINHFRCDVRFREVAGFSRKSPEKRDQGLKKPVEVDFAQVGQGGPWVVSRMEAPTPLGSAAIELKRLQVRGRPPAG